MPASTQPRVAMMWRATCLPITRSGATIVETTGGLQVTGRTATLRAALAEDLVVAIRYVMAP